MQPIALINYIFIENAVKAEIQRLLPSPDYTGSTRAKAQEISGALERLYLMTIQKNPGTESTHMRSIFLAKINPEEASEIDLKTIRSMLNANISEWESEIEPWTEQGMEFNGRRAGFKSKISLRIALNIANNNIFNLLGCTWGPLWGETTALENVEKKLGIHLG